MDSSRKTVARREERWALLLFFAPVLLASASVLWAIVVLVWRGRLPFDRDFSSFYFDLPDLIFLFAFVCIANLAFVALASVFQAKVDTLKREYLLGATIGAASFLVVQNYTILKLIYITVVFDVVDFFVIFAFVSIFLLIVSVPIGIAGYFFGKLQVIMVLRAGNRKELDAASIAVVCAISLAGGILALVARERLFFG